MQQSSIDQRKTMELPITLLKIESSWRCAPCAFKRSNTENENCPLEGQRAHIICKTIYEALTGYPLRGWKYKLASVTHTCPGLVTSGVTISALHSICSVSEML